MTNSSSLLGSLEPVPAEVVDKAMEALQVVEKPASMVEDLVGDGKRFTDVESLAKAKLESDKHIEQVEAENKALREKLESMDNNYATILKKLEETNTPTNVSTHDKDANVDPVNVSKLVEEALTTREKEMLRKQNLRNSWEKLSQTYGNLDNAKHAVEELLKEKPYMTSVIDNLAVSDPDLMVKEMMSLRNPQVYMQSKANNPVDNLNTKMGDNTDEGGFITWSEARKVMFNDPKKYSSKEFDKLVKASQMHYKSKGIDFYSQT